MSSCPEDLVGLRRIIALKASESETGAKDKNSEDDEMARKPTGQGFCILNDFFNSSAKSQGSIKCLS
jgi:hypothetical protein